VCSREKDLARIGIYSLFISPLSLIELEGMVDKKMRVKVGDEGTYITSDIRQS